MPSVRSRLVIANALSKLRPSLRSGQRGELVHDDVGPRGEDGLAHGGGVERVEHDGLGAQRPDLVRPAAGGADDVVAALDELGVRRRPRAPVAPARKMRRVFMRSKTRQRAEAVTAEDLRPLMLSIAYRMVGSFSEAEDIVQEAFVRLHQAGEVESPQGVAHARSSRGWRSTTCARRACGASSTPARGCPSRCSPTPRPTPPSAPSRSTWPCSCCSRASRRSSARSSCCARRSTTATTRSPRSSARARPTAASSRPARAATWTSAGRASSPRASSARSSCAASSQALEEGETEPLVELLAADVEFYGDGGGKAPAVGRVVSAPRRSSASWPGSRASAGAAARRRRSPRSTAARACSSSTASGLVAVWTFDFSGDAVQAIRGVTNPDKLAHISSTILPSLPPALKRS